MPQAAEYVKMLDIEIDDLARRDFPASVINRAERRIQEAIIDNSVSKGTGDAAVEVPSFPIAVILMSAIGDLSLKRKYSLAEAKRVSSLLTDEKDETILDIAKNFKWNITLAKQAFSLHFRDFLRNASVLQSKKWKLVNRMLVNGEVTITKIEVSRLLQEEVRKYIEEKLDTKVSSLPPPVMERVDRIRRLFLEKKRKVRFEELPKESLITALPPCIKLLYDATASGRHISHIGRFTLTTFLTNTGMSVEKVVDLFRSLPDFNEKLTRYQVEHVAGARGSRTKYIPPRCDTLRTHGVCAGMDELCKRIRHPLSYYRIKFRNIRRAVPKE
jgi:DNA primase large subunit